MHFLWHISSNLVPVMTVYVGNKAVGSLIFVGLQFSVTDHFKEKEPGKAQSLPGVFFFYDLSPIKVKFTERRTSFFHFLTNVCAIVGGVFTVAGIIDAFVYHGQRAIRKKIDLGKHR
jgi:hypothetical protein